MNPRQRRGVMLMILAALGAVVVFVSVLSYVGQVREQVGNMQPVLQLTQDVPANTVISADMVEEVESPTRWLPDTIVGGVQELEGKVAAADLPQGAYLQQGMIMTAPELKPNQREIAIMVNAETGVAGKVHAGSVVDVYAAFPATEQSPACAIRVLSSVQVLQVGQQKEQQDTSGGQASTTSVVPITFALSAQQSLGLTYVEANADTVRLARLGGASSGKAPSQDSVCRWPRTGNANGGGGGAGGGGGDQQ